MKFGGGKDDAIVLQSLRSRKPVPAEIANAPVLTESNELAWRCFWDLRRGADEVNALRWFDVLLWANAYSLSVFEMEGLQYSIAILDSVFLPFMREKREIERKRREAQERGQR